MKEFLWKRGLDVRQGRRMVQDKCEWWGFVRGNARDVPLTLTRCHNCGLPQLYGTVGWNYVCGRTYNLKDITRKISFFLKLRFSFTVTHFHGMMRADASPNFIFLYK